MIPLPHPPGAELRPQDLLTILSFVIGFLLGWVSRKLDHYHRKESSQ